MQRVEAPSQPFRLTGSGGEGNGVARHHDDHYSTSQRSQNGGMRPILDLSVFHMLTIKRVLECVHKDDWFTSIDLKPAHIYSM